MDISIPLLIITVVITLANLVLQIFSRIKHSKCSNCEVDTTNPEATTAPQPIAIPNNADK